MKSARTIWVVAGLGMVCRMPAQAQAEVRATLQERYDRFNASLVNRNITALTALCTADCKLQIRPGGPALSLDQFRQQAPTQFGKLILRRARTHIDSLAVSGSQARVQETWTGDLTSGAEANGRQRVHTVQRLQDVWTRTPAGWLLSSSSVVSVKTAVYGKASR